MTIPEPAKYTIQEGIELMTGAESLATERHYGKHVEELSSVAVTVAAVWAHERRRLLGQPDRPDWADIEAWTMRQLNDYFAADEIEIDPDDPETDEGKDD